MVDATAGCEADFTRGGILVVIACGSASVCRATFTPIVHTPSLSAPSSAERKPAADRPRERFLDDLSRRLALAKGGLINEYARAA
jgi:hypothetical protein